MWGAAAAWSVMRTAFSAASMRGIISGWARPFFQAKGHVLPDHSGHNLVSGFERPSRRCGFPTAGRRRWCPCRRPAPGLCGQIQGVHKLGQGAFARTVVAQNGHKGALLNGKGDMVDGQGALGVIAEGNVRQFQGMSGLGIFAHGCSFGGWAAQARAWERS